MADDDAAFVLLLGLFAVLGGRRPRRVVRAARQSFNGPRSVSASTTPSGSRSRTVNTNYNTVLLLLLFPLATQLFFFFSQIFSLNFFFLSFSRALRADFPHRPQQHGLEPTPTRSHAVDDTHPTDRPPERFTEGSIVSVRRAADFRSVRLLAVFTWAFFLSCNIVVDRKIVRSHES